MNWNGALFGVSLVLALLGAGAAAFAASLRAAVRALVPAMFGVAGVLFAMGHGYTATCVAVILGLFVPFMLLLTLRVAPGPEPDRRGGRTPWVTPSIVLALAGLAWIAMRAPWPPAGGGRQDGIEWLGSRLLTDHLLLLDLMAMLLATAACGAIALLRGRAARR